MDGWMFHAFRWANQITVYIEARKRIGVLKNNSFVVEWMLDALYLSVLFPAPVFFLFSKQTNDQINT